ncbi:sulfite exporter TauE/SafE family protein [Marinomonas pollencensis]|uniref:Probable membrane transporter protein n=1 Tax=Marinomonas pollencensis TaxID=491954 RepID=A0A3E0DUR2_9GAMM|nr:sulfite exporter TauE/SafE family protein [Marinomonas pollencensis]REG86648.1 hypothetical protein DFP81_101213 [Marinomonas pollencensis]
MNAAVANLLTIWRYDEAKLALVKQQIILPYSSSIYLSRDPSCMENLAYLIPIVFFAGIIRGYAGFGFAVIAVIGLNLFLDPIKSVPIVLALDFICSIGLIREAIKHANMHTFRIIAGGSILGIPIGLVLLYLVPALWLKLAICSFVLVLVALLIKKAKPAQHDSFGKKLLTGIASGVGTSSASIGGPMILYYILSSPLDVRAQRATMILFFIVSEFVALMGIGLSQPSSNEIYTTILWLLAPTMVGVKIGQFFFNKRPPKSFKSISLPIMVVVAMVGFAQAFQVI